MTPSVKRWQFLWNDDAFCEAMTISVKWWQLLWNDDNAVKHCKEILAEPYPSIDHYQIFEPSQMLRKDVRSVVFSTLGDIFWFSKWDMKERLQKTDIINGSTHGFLFCNLSLWWMHIPIFLIVLVLYALDSLRTFHPSQQVHGQSCMNVAMVISPIE